jgi:hypothetical protein
MMLDVYHTGRNILVAGRKVRYNFEQTDVDENIILIGILRVIVRTGLIWHRIMSSDEPFY